MFTRYTKAKKYGRRIITLLLLAACCLMSGCDLDYNEIENLSIVMGTAIDRTDDSGYKLTTEIAEIGESSGTPSVEGTILQTEGSSIFGAAQNGIAITGKRPYYGHAKVVVVSQQIAQDGLLPVLDFALRDSESRITTLFLVSSAETAGEIFDAKAFNSPLVSDGIEKILDAKSQTSQAPTVPMQKLLDLYYQRGSCMVLPLVHVIEGEENEGEKSFDVSGCALFKDDKMAGTLDVEDTRMFLFASGQVEGGVLNDYELGYPDDKNLALKIDSCEVKRKPVLENGVLKIKIELSITASLAEAGNENADTINQMRNEIPTVASQGLSANIHNLIRKVQETYGADIFGFGDLVRQDMPNYWRGIENQWEEIFKTLPVEISTKLTLNDSEMIHGNIRSMVGR